MEWLQFDNNEWLAAQFVTSKYSDPQTHFVFKDDSFRKRKKISDNPRCSWVFFTFRVQKVAFPIWQIKAVVQADERYTL